jgi:N-acetyl-anhydromuramyl-L-alanine amidase AmpD
MINKKILTYIFLATSTMGFASYDPQANEKNTTLYCQPHRQDATTPKTAQPTMIVLNYSQRPTAEASHQSCRDCKLSTHHIIDKDGKSYKGISEQLEETPTINNTPIIDPEYLKLRAFHTGVGYWNGDKQEIKNINTHAIGILFVNEASNKNNNPDYTIGNPENTTQWRPYTSEQLQSFVLHAQKLKEKYNIADKDIVGYHEVRTNNGVLNGGGGVGPLFPWKQAAQQGVGLYHNLTENELSHAPQTSIEDLQQDLHAWGYSVTINGQTDAQTNAAIKQLQIHHDPLYFDKDNQINTARTSLIIKNLLAQHYAQKKSSSHNDNA